MSELKVVIGADDSKLLSAAKRDEKELGKVGEAAEKAGQRAADAMNSAGEAAGGMAESTKESAQAMEDAGKAASSESKVMNELAESVGELIATQKRQLGVLDEINGKMHDQQESESKLNDTEKQRSDLLVKLMGGQQSYNAIMAALPPEIKSAMSALEGLITASRAFIATPLGMVVAALGTSVALLTSYFRGATDGEDEFVKISGYAKGVMTALKDEAIDAGRSLYHMFDNPQAAAIRFTSKAITPLINRFHALTGYVRNVGDMMKAIFENDFNSDTWEKLAKNQAKMSAQLLTGVNVDAEVDALDKINSKAKTREELEKRQHEVNIKRISLMEREAEIDKELAVLRRDMYSSDPTKRLQAQAKAQELVNEKYDEQIRLAKEEAKIQEGLEANSSSTYADKEATARAKARVTELETAKSMAMLPYDRRAISAENTLNRQAQKEEKEQAKAKNNIALLEKRQAEQEKRDARQRAIQIEEAKIAGLEEGHEKVVRQLKLQGEKELLAIEQQKDEVLMKKIAAASQKFNADISNVGKVFDMSSVSLSEEELADFDRLVDAVKVKIAKAENDIALKEAAAMRNYLKEYGTYQQQRLAIAEEYADRIKKAQTEGEKLTVKKEQEKALADIDMRELNAKVDWEVIFNDLDKVSKSHLQQLRDNLEAYLKDGIKKGTISPENAKVIAERVAAINKEVQSRAVFSMKGATAQGYDDAKTRMQAQLDELKAKQTKATADELGQLSEQIISVIDAMADLEKQEKSAKTQAREIGEGFSKVAQQLQGLSNLVDAVGLGNTNFGESVKNVASGVSNAASAFTNFADGNWFQSAADAVTAIQDFGRAFGIGGGNADEVVRTTERLTKANELLTQRVSDLTDAIGNSAGLKAMAAYEAAMEAQEEINKNNLEVLRQQMGYNNAHHSNAYYADDRKIASYNAQAQKAFKAAGVKGANITGLESMMMLSPEQMKALRDFVPELWKYVTTVGKYDKSDFWDKVVEQAGKAEKLTEQIRNNLTQTSFDGLRSSWLDTLTDMEASSEDFAQSFEDMMYKAVVNALVLDDEFDEWLEDWQEKYAKAVKNGNMAMLEQLESESAAMREQKVQQADEYALQMGYRRGSTGATATVNAAKSIGEDTAQDIVGRMTSIQLSNEREATAAQTIAASMTTAMSYLASLTQQAEASRGVLTEMRTLMIYGNSYLEDIAKHTKAMHEEWGMKIDRMTNKLENL